ncbi:MAG: diguanylate cyclase [Bacillota bacterium]
MEESSSNQGGKQDIQIHDLLTGAYSRALLYEQFPVELERAKRYGMALSLCIMDLDYFKSINDAYGHSRGDEVLQAFTRKINSIIRKSDILFRYGGDEFVLLMLNTNKEQAVITAERILEKIIGAQVPGDPPINISSSMGIASFPEDASTTDQLFKMADERCYEAKQRGRGQVVSEIFVFKRDFQFDKISRLIERDEALTKINSFYQELLRKKRGVLNVTGISGSGRTSFINKSAVVAEIFNYKVITLYASEEARAHPYGAFKEANSGDFLPGKINLHEFEKFLLKISEESKRAGLIILLDNFQNVDHATLNLFRQLLVSKEDFCLGLVYSSDNESTRSLGYLNFPLVETVNLLPFSIKGTRVWLRSVLSWDPPTDFLEWLYRETRGVPKLMKESVTYLLDQGILQRTGRHEWFINSRYSTVMLRKYRRNNNRIPPNNLPASLTEFIERENETDEVNTLLDRGRLITLVGPGGIGKTRLSLEIAAKRLRDFEDGVFFVPLSSITRESLVIPIISKTLNIKEKPGRSVLESVKDALHNKHLLLILDNFEQVISAASQIIELLISVPLLTIIVTSREALHISGEHVFNVPSLEVPKPEQKLSLDKMVQKSAIALFITRAQAIRHDFVVTEDTASLIAALCTRLDGIPLAIELAAANVGQVSLEEMLEQSQNCLKWLNNGLRDLPTRHQTLRSTIEWSYSLLKESEKHLFDYLGVFAGGFDTAAVNAVINSDNYSCSNKEVMSLVDKCLLRKIAGKGKKDGIYFEMLETIREYAVERLTAGGKAEELQQRHAEYYLALALEAEQNLNGPGQHKWLDRIEQAHSNIRVVLEWAQKTGRTEVELELAGSLGQFWEIRGYWSEGCTRLENIINKYNGILRSEYYAKVYQWAGRLTHLRGDHERAAAILNEGLSLCIETGNRLGEADTLYKLGWAVCALGHLKEGERLWQKSLTLYREMGNKAGISASLQELGLVCYYEGEYELAEKYSSESLKLSMELEDKRAVSRALNRLGRAARGMGDYNKAVKLFNEHLESCQELDDKEGMADSILNMAELARSQRDYKLSEELYSKALDLGRELGYKYLIARSLKDLGEIARYQRNFEKADRLYNESLIILRETGDDGGIMWLYRNMGELQLQQGDHVQAKEFFLSSLKIYRQNNQATILLVLLLLEGLAEVASVQEDFIKAARLFGASYSLLKACEKIIAKDDIEEYEQRMRKVQLKLDEDTFNIAWNEGRSMSLDVAMDYAMDK